VGAGAGAGRRPAWAPRAWFGKRKRHGGGPWSVAFLRGTGPRESSVDRAALSPSAAGGRLSPRQQVSSTRGGRRRVGCDRRLAKACLGRRAHSFMCPLVDQTRNRTPSPCSPSGRLQHSYWQLKSLLKRSLHLSAHLCMGGRLVCTQSLSGRRSSCCDHRIRCYACAM
jgi:hypothetical protein